MQVRAAVRKLGLFLILCMLVAFLLPVPHSDVWAAIPSNMGFEDDLTGWTQTGVITPTNVSILGSTTFGYSASGSKLALLYSGYSSVNYSTMAESLALGALEEEYLNTLFSNVEHGLIADGRFCYVYRDLTLEAGESFNMAWGYTLASTSLFSSSASFCSFVNLTDPASTGTIDGYPVRLLMLGAGMAEYGNYVTSMTGSTGWQTTGFTAGTAGVYRFAMCLKCELNAGASVLVIDDMPGTYTLNNAPGTPISIADPQLPLAVASPATVTTGVMETPAATSVRGHGTIVSNGGADVTEWGLVAAASGTPTVSDIKGIAGSIDAAGAFAADLTGLTPGTTYTARAYAINSAGVSYGEPVSFTTGMEAPVAEASLPAPDAFVLGWDPIAGATGYKIQVATDVDFASPVTGFDEREVGTALTAEITGLSANTVYYARVQALGAACDSSWSDAVQIRTTLRPQSITFGPLPEMTYGDAPVTLAGVSGSGLPLLYTSSNPLVATVEDGVLRIVGPGTTVITATQPGDEIWSAAEPVPQTLVVLAAPVTPTVTPTVVPLPDAGESTEPTTRIAGLGLLAVAFCGVAVLARRRRQEG